MAAYSSLSSASAVVCSPKPLHSGRIVRFPSDWEFMQHEHETSSKLISWLFFLLNGVCVGNLVSEGCLLAQTLLWKAFRLLFPSFGT
ncbi:MAG: hypothetical protein ACTS4U_01455 [Candidatus Hodgkinia cicadicola]